jgi:hypothetical protein
MREDWFGFLFSWFIWLELVTIFINTGFFVVLLTLVMNFRGVLLLFGLVIIINCVFIRARLRILL